MNRMLRLLGLLCFLLSSCSSPFQTEQLPIQAPTFIGGLRPAEVVVPREYDHKERYPLIILLHGYSATARLNDLIFQLERRVDIADFILLLPEGTENPDGDQFWNATPECCDYFGQGVDDVVYLTALIEEAKATLAVDPQHVVLLGHSNGGYMAYRMACEYPKLFKRIVVVAGLSFLNPQDCLGQDPVSLVHVHGTEDEVVSYDLGADEVSRWLSKGGCDTGFSLMATKDFNSGLMGEETEILIVRGHEVCNFFV
ncbi:putative esterase NocK [Ylistrum balloti]|uniref:putative esterase NocK n=1 Tax=Ylistrum balloti TaxID=509963 RepID=UPI002905D52F|nr:putative esterase NocK [Ylistrum balloti]